MKLNDVLRTELTALERRDLRRHLQAFDSTPLLDFASNDYLGLRRHPSLIEAAQRATENGGTGAGASRLVTGTSHAGLALEERLAQWKEKEAALIFGSGYAAALGVIPALVGRGDTVILDKLSHACLIDAARLSGAIVRTIPHNQLDRLEDLLRKVTRTSGRVLIATESLFSMDGDTAPLRSLVELKDRYGAWLLVDEAHATGLYGRTGAGLIAEQGLSAQIEIVMGTMSKALGSIGGYIAGSHILIDWLVNRARSFIYSTALPPGAIAASSAAVQLAQSSAGEALRQGLRDHIVCFRKSLSLDKDLSQSAIQPVVCGKAAAALALSHHLREAGYLVPAIRYPTVARKSARLRVTLRATHTPQEINGLVQVLSVATASILADENNGPIV